MHVNAAPPMQLDSFGVKTLRIVPLAHSGRVNRRLVVDRGAVVFYFVLVDLRYRLMEFGQNLRERSWLADRIEGHVPVRHHQHQSSLTPQDPLELANCRNGIRQVLNHMTGDYDIQGITGDGCQSVDVQIDVEVGCGTMRQTD